MVNISPLNYHQIDNVSPKLSIVTMLPQTTETLLICSDPNYYLSVSSLVRGVNLGFGSLRTLERQFGHLGGRTLGQVDKLFCL